MGSTVLWSRLMATAVLLSLRHGKGLTARSLSIRSKPRLQAYNPKGLKALNSQDMDID